MRGVRRERMIGGAIGRRFSVMGLEVLRRRRPMLEKREPAI
jgi:hypothetical protein